MLGLRCCRWAFPSCSEWRLLPSCSTWTSRCCGFSWERRLEARWLQSLQLAGSRGWTWQLWHMGLAAPWHVGSSRTRAQTHDPCIGKWILNHWTSREVLNSAELKEEWNKGLQKASTGLPFSSSLTWAQGRCSINYIDNWQKSNLLIIFFSCFPSFIIIVTSLITAFALTAIFKLYWMIWWTKLLLWGWQAWKIILLGT